MDFVNHKKIHESNNTAIYEGYDVSNNTVILKVLKQKYPTDIELFKFNNEFELTNNIQIKGVRKALKLNKIKGRHTLVLEYFEGKTLKDTFCNQKFNINKFLSVAINICKTIGELHQKNIIHKDINSYNILVNKQNDIRIIDFGISTKYDIKTQNLGNPEHLEGTLAYISPEQTGRMNRTVDYRTDLYSLGIVFYELLTGQLPFDNLDPLEIVHSHISKLAIAPHEINKNIPRILSDIILKLISKNAEDRYQSAFGIKYDLEYISKKSNLIKREIYGNFKIAFQDFSGKLVIPEKIYGRKKEIKKLLEIYDRVLLGSKELLIIEGFSGVGKSMLVHEIHKPITSKKGIYLEGKFDKFQMSTPYYAFTQVFKNFIDIILTENEKKLTYWKHLIISALDGLGKVLTNYFPEIEDIIGRQAEVPKLKGFEAQNRFNYVWSNFIKAICKPEHPVIIFVDDMQWADSASIELLKILLSDFEISNFLCITAYRENEISFSHPFIKFIDDLGDNDLVVNKIKVRNLNEKDTKSFIIDALNPQDTKNTFGLEQLSQLVYEKTKGNVFFVIQFLKTLYEENLLWFNQEKKWWTWSFINIESRNVTDNVVKLVANKILKLPIATQKILKLASCIGNKFEFDLLNTLYNKDSETTKNDLRIAIHEQLIINYDFINFKFIHDRVQQAVYSTIPENKRKEYHYKIGNLLLENPPKKVHNSYEFEIANQLNFCTEFINNKDEVKQLAMLNYNAGVKAKESLAYQQSYSYFNKSLNLIDKNSWETDYNFTLNVYDKLAEITYLIGMYEESEVFINAIINNANNILDTINSNIFLINIHTAQANYIEAIAIGNYLFNKLGVHIPKKTNKIHIIKEYIKTSILIKRKGVDNILTLPKLTERKYIAIVNIISAVGSSVYLTEPNVFPIITLKALQIFIKKGISESTPFVFTAYSVILVMMKKIMQAKKISDIALELIGITNSVEFTARANYMANFTVYPWSVKLHDIHKSFKKIYKIGNETGDIEFAAYSLSSLNFISNIIGKNLELLNSDSLKELNILKKLKQSVSIKRQEIYLQYYYFLINENAVFETFKGTYFNEEKEIPILKKSNDLSTLSYLYIFKTILYYLFGMFEKAYQNANDTNKYTSGIKANYLIVIHTFYYSLSMLALYNKKDKKTKAKFLKIVKNNQQKIKNWSKNCISNFQHKFDIVQAELMRVLNKTDKARNLYDKAITGARNNNFLNEEALIWELTGRFYFEQNKFHLAEYNMQNAYKCYKIWGANSKSKRIVQKYPNFIFNENQSEQTTNNTINTRTTVGGFSDLSFDVNSILKASQSLSGEVKLEKLLNNMMIILLQNAGAEKGAILSNNKDILKIEAKGNYKDKQIEVLQNQKVTNSNKLPLSILRYVKRTKNTIVLNNAFKDSRFNTNEYIKKEKIKSILCHPIINKTELTAIIYLENNLSVGAFTPQRLKTIEILSSQIAISIENALLYKTLEERVEERTLKLENAYKNILASINYAKKIQSAILPSKKAIQEIIPESFVLYKPRDIVSGDFYWISKKVKTLIITAADSTGHGVPGAFMSMLGISFLNEITSRNMKNINSNSINSADILNQLRELIKKSLRQTKKSTEARDGIDMALCMIDKQTNTMQYAGANNPLYLIRNNELIITKGTKNPVGIYIKEKPFINHIIQLEKNDIIYLFTDGYQDQLGGLKNRKFTPKRLRELLLEINQKPMDIQKNILDKNIIEWIGKGKQIDDILILGFKI